MLDGKFYVLDSDDSDEEGLYRPAEEQGNMQSKQRTFKRLQKKAQQGESDDSEQEQLDKEELDQLHGGSLDNIKMYSEAH